MKFDIQLFAEEDPEFDTGDGTETGTLGTSIEQGSGTSSEQGSGTSKNGDETTSTGSGTSEDSNGTTTTTTGDEGTEEPIDDAGTTTTTTGDEGTEEPIDDAGTTTDNGSGTTTETETTAEDGSTTTTQEYGTTLKQNYQNIADAIREKTGSTDTMKPTEMASKISEMKYKPKYFYRCGTPVEGENTASGIEEELKNISFADVYNYNYSASRCLEYMFYQCYIVRDTDKEEQELDLVFNDLPAVSSTRYMFAGCNYSGKNPLSSLTMNKNDYTEVTDAIYMFNRCGFTKKIVLGQFSDKVSTTYMFNQCSTVETIDLSAWDRSSEKSNLKRKLYLKNPTGMFQDCSAKTIKMPSSICLNGNADYMFRVSATNMPTEMQIQLADTHNIEHMFASNPTIKSVIFTGDESNSFDANNAFQNCSSLTSLSFKDTSICPSASFNAFHLIYKCPALTDLNVDGFDMSKCTNWETYAFFNTSPLTNDSLNSILKALGTLPNTYTNKTLKEQGLTSDQATTCTTLSNWQTLSDNGWTTGY